MQRLRVERVGKRYKHYQRPGDRLREWATLGRRRRHQERWAVRGISFDAAPGEALGLVGANGAGKSTLLDLISGALAPSEGTVETAGRLAPLRLGLGFHPDFSGRSNLFAAGGLLGLGPAEVDALLPGILDFAEVGCSLDDPVRTLSTGMQLRLAFSLATAVRPDVLLIDEALAVGDAYFQQKCMMRIRSFRELGTTVLLVSHDAAVVRAICDRALLLEEGLLVRHGPPDEVLDYYNAMVARRSKDDRIRVARHGPRASTRSGDGRASVEDVALGDGSRPSDVFPVGSRMTVEVSGRAHESVEDLTVGISIRDRAGTEIFGTNTHHLGFRDVAVDAGKPFHAHFELPASLGVGAYSLTVALHAGSVHLEGSYDWWDRVSVFQVIPGDEAPFVGSTYLPARAHLTSGTEARGGHS